MSWAQIFVFYVCSYAFLAAFFYGMLSVFLKYYVNTKVPSLTGQHSVLKFTPGVGIHPRLEITDTFFQVTNYPSTLNAKYIREASEYISSYQNVAGTADCSAGIPSNFPDVPCRFPLSTLGPCENPANAILNGGPCIYFRLNRIYGWLPNIANNSVLPNAAIRCSGQNVMDNHLLGTPTYYPAITASDGQIYGSIPNTYFPYLNQPSYQTPMVAVQFPNIQLSTVVLIECKVHGLETDQSSVTFELSVDGRPPAAAAAP